MNSLSGSMYVKLFNLEPGIKSTMVVRKVRQEGFDMYMPLLYRDTCIPYRSTQ